MNLFTRSLLVIGSAILMMAIFKIILFIVATGFGFLFHNFFGILCGIGLTVIAIGVYVHKANNHE